MENSIPVEIVHADDCDFITEIEKTKDKIYVKAKEIMTSKNLLVNKERLNIPPWKEGQKKRKENGEMW